MKKLFAILACLVSTSVLADVNTANAISGSNSASNSGSTSAALQGNKQDVNISSPASIDTHVSGHTSVRTVATVYAPPIGVTAPCFIGLSGGITVMGFGASLGGSMEDQGCTLRETSRLLHGIGHPDAAARVMCNNSQAAVALGPVICPVASAGQLPTAAQPPAGVAGRDVCNADPYIAARMNIPVCK